MIRIWTIAALLGVAAPAHATDPDDGLSTDQRAVIAGLDAFWDALRSDDKTALASAMTTDGLLVIHNRMDADNPVIVTRTVSEHLENWLNSPPGLDEFMAYEHILVDGDMAQVWGPYSFHIGENVSHCGINNITMVKVEDGTWKVGNTSFSMVPPSQCTDIGADWVDGDDS